MVYGAQKGNFQSDQQSYRILFYNYPQLAWILAINERFGPLVIFLVEQIQLPTMFLFWVFCLFPHIRSGTILHGGTVKEKINIIYKYLSKKSED